MKRLLLHLLFWAIYVLQDFFMGIAWIAPALGPVAKAQLWITVLQAVGWNLIPKFILTYFLLRVTVKEIMAANVNLYGTVGKLLIVILCCVLIYRSVGYYYIYPVIYAGRVQPARLLDFASGFIALIDIGFVAGTAVSIKFVKVQLQSKDREKQLIRDKLETELKFLRNQMHPHFLLNTLNNIYGLARKRSSKTAEVVLRLSELLRFMLYETSSKLIQIDSEIKLTECYLELETIRYNERLSLVFNKQTDQQTYQITPLLLLPFVENAFKHGISESRFESYLYMDLQILNGTLRFEIENSKDEYGVQSKCHSIGLSNIRRQLELSYKTYNLEVKNEEHCFKALLTLDINSHVEI